MKTGARASSGTRRLTTSVRSCFGQDNGSDPHYEQIMRVFSREGMGQRHSVFKVGGCAVLSHAVFKGRECLSKVSKKDDYDWMIANEHRILQKLSGCPCVPREFGYRNEVLYLERIPGKNFNAYLDSCDKDQGMAIITDIVDRLFAGLSFLHQRKIVHRDIKPDNLIIASDGKVFFVDFGCSIDLDCPSNWRRAVGTEEFCAPEVLSNCLRSPEELLSADIWSLGVVIRFAISHMGCARMNEQPAFLSMMLNMDPGKRGTLTDCWQSFKAWKKVTTVSEEVPMT
ncbi:MAG: protein kinase family protein [Sulfobacillus sp.]